MQEKHLFEYAVIRVVPRVEREEFINAGIVLYCRDQRFLGVMFSVDEDRLRSLCPLLDIEELKEHLKAFEQIAIGNKHAGPIAKLDLAGRFRWLTATRSTIVQASKVHPGLCDDAGEMLERLYNQLVL
ncbi:MAG: DUF3037 domain-containing protein [Sphingobacteriales bacterium]|jgi:hypothetical protein|nr:DUF3037 domain-containing protein [Sphingobacteriales bacterium]OJW01255.1 MAG: hypothetical protein BGO52_07430 [Sphingobacteriales bacterium 44-61]